MKKLSLLIAVVFAALALSSCSKDDASLPIKSKNLVGTWCFAQRIWDDGEIAYYDPWAYGYEELAFTNNTVTQYIPIEYGVNELEEGFQLEYTIKGEDLWLGGWWRYATIKKLTSEELLLDLVGEHFNDLYRKKK